MPKNALLVLDQGANVIGNYVFSNNGEITYEEIIKFVGETGIGRNVIFYGKQNNLDIINYLSGRLKNLNINVFVYIVTSSDIDTVQGYYK